MPKIIKFKGIKGEIKMTKNEMIGAVANKIEGATKKDIAVVVNEVFDTIKNTLASGEKVAIAGFGTFEVTERAARECKNPRTGEPVHVEASKAPKFKASKNFKDVVNA